MDCSVHGVCVRARVADVQIDGPVHRHMSRQMLAGRLWDRPGPLLHGVGGQQDSSSIRICTVGQGRVKCGLVRNCNLA